MKHNLFTVFIACTMCLLAVPALAADAKTEAAGTFSWQQGADTGRTWSAEFVLDAPLGKYFAVGPVLQASYYSQEVNPDPAESGSLSLVNFGGEFVWFLTGAKHDGLQLGGQVLIVGGDGSGYLGVPFVGLEFGSGNAFFRARLSHPYSYSVDTGDTVDLQRSTVTAGFGMRF